MFIHNLDASDSKYELDHFLTNTVNVWRKHFYSPCRKSKIRQWAKIGTFILTQVD